MRLRGKIEKLKEAIVLLNAMNVQMMESEDKQISLTDPDCPLLLGEVARIPHYQISRLRDHAPAHPAE